MPERILARRKVGFRVPVNEWFRGPMRDYLRDHLQSASSSRPGLTTMPAFSTGVLAEHMGGRHNHEKLLWALLNLEIWHRHYA